MKQTFLSVFTSALFISNIALSASPTYNIDPVEPEKKVIINNFRFFKPIFDENQNFIKLDETATRFSKKNKESYCWYASIDPSLPIGTTVKYTEVFQSPSKSLFATNNPNTKITSSEDENVWIIQSSVGIDENYAINSCWELTDEDPIGNYILNINVGGQTQPEVRFNVVE